MGRQLLHTFKHDGYEPTWQQLLEWHVGLRRGQRPAADRLMNCVSERRDMIKYPEFIAKGWQIGSGPTEATCKTLNARLKGSGMRWDADKAEALMAGGSDAKRPMGLLEKSAKANGLSTPGGFARHERRTALTSKTDVAYRPGKC